MSNNNSTVYNNLFNFVLWYFVGDFFLLGIFIRILLFCL